MILLQAKLLVSGGKRVGPLTVETTAMLCRLLRPLARGTNLSGKALYTYSDREVAEKDENELRVKSKKGTICLDDTDETQNVRIVANSTIRSHISHHAH